MLRRALLLYGLGLIYYGGYQPSLGPTSAISACCSASGICYLFASLMFLNLNLRGMIAAFVALLAGYWALMTFVPVPGIGAGSFAPDANLANWIDAHYLPGRLWDKTRDPEGLLSTLPAIGTCLLGVFAGLLLKNERFTPQQKSLWLIGGGIVLVRAGHLWGLQFPVIKAIWTSSFVLVAGGYSADPARRAGTRSSTCGAVRAWSTIFMWIGANAITLYFFEQRVRLRAVRAALRRRRRGAVFRRHADAGQRRLHYALVGVAIAVMLAGFFYRRKIFLKV